MDKSDLDKALEAAGAPKYKFSKELVRYKSEGDEIKVVTPAGTKHFELIKLVTIHDAAA